METNYLALAISLARAEARQYTNVEILDKAHALRRLAQPIYDLPRIDLAAERAGRREWEAML